MGVLAVEEKTKRALALYSEILTEFSYYENVCLYDTVINGLPEFFKWYDIRFEPQNTILTLDYPILQVKNTVAAFVQNYYENCSELLEYLSDSIGGVVSRLKNASDSRSLNNII